MNFGGWHRERARLSLIGLNRSRHTSRPPTGLQRESSAHSPADEFLKFVCQEQADGPERQRSEDPGRERGGAQDQMSDRMVSSTATPTRIKGLLNQPSRNAAMRSERQAKTLATWAATIPAKVTVVASLYKGEFQSSAAPQLQPWLYK